MERLNELLIIVFVTIITVMNVLGTELYLENFDFFKKKKYITIYFSLFAIFNIFYMIYKENVIMLPLVLLSTSYCIAYLCKRYISQNNILERLCEEFVIVFSVFMWFVLVNAKLNAISGFKASSIAYSIEFCLLYVIIMHVILLLKYYKKMTRRNLRDIKVVTSVLSLVYFFVAFILNPNYIKLKVIFLVFLSIGIIILIIKKMSNLLKIFLGVLTLIVYSIISINIYKNNIILTEVSTEINKIYISKNLDSLSSYNNKEKFIIYDREKFDKKLSIDIYSIQEEDGKKDIVRRSTIKDYKVTYTQNEMYLEEVITVNEVKNNNLASKPKNIEVEKDYRLYYYK